MVFSTSPFSQGCVAASLVVAASALPATGSVDSFTGNTVLGFKVVWEAALGNRGLCLLLRRERKESNVFVLGWYLGKLREDSEIRWGDSNPMK